MTKIIRVIFPVGHGGFAAEIIDDKHLTILDCGSLGNRKRLSLYIDAIKNYGFNCVDRLFLTHFDRDHVNCIKELIKKIGVREVVIPFIPHDMRYVYNSYTKGAYMNILNLFSNHKDGFELNEVEHDSIIPYIDIWEWNAKCLLTPHDWQNLRKEFISKKLDVKKIMSSNYPAYLEQNSKTINGCFRSTFGKNGPNSKGLIVLSQKCNNINTDICIIIRGCSQLFPAIHTGCLYTGDANLKKNAQVESHVKSIRHEQKMSLTQIPHHGSNNNSDNDFDTSFDSEYYFYCDKNDIRIQKNQQLYNRLITTKQLLGVRNSDMDLVVNLIVLH